MGGIKDKIRNTVGNNKLKSAIYKPTDIKDSEFTFRALPYKHQEDNDPFIEVYLHNNIGKDGNQFALCPEKTLGETCPYCDTARKMKDKLSSEDWKEVAKKMFPKASVYIPGIARFNKQEPQIGFLKVSQWENFKQQIVEGIMISTRLKRHFKLPDDTDFINIFDIKSGVDLIVQKQDKTASQKYAKFKIEADLEMSPAIKNKTEKELVKEYLADTPNLINEMIEVWGCVDEINEYFLEQYPKKASPTKPGKTSGTTSHAVSENESALPESDDAGVSGEDLDDLMNAQLSDDDSDIDSLENEDSGSDDIGTEDDYDSLMKDLE